MGDFESRAADISVDHPEVVAHYRAAQAIAVRDKRGEADTEELRKAVVHYRALFDELLEIKKRFDNKQCQHKTNERTAIMNEEKKETSLTTADLLAATEIPTAQRQTGEEGQLAALFLPDVAKDFRSRWDAVQISFVDDPRLAVQQAMSSLPKL